MASQDSSPSANTVPTSTRIAAAFKTLTAAAAEINTVSDELAKAIEPIDSALKRLNIGIPVWLQIAGPFDPEIQQDYIGYARVDGKWGLALSVVHGDPEHGGSNLEWLFNDAPRAMRLDAFQHIPTLIERMAQQTALKAAEIKSKVQQAHEIAAALKGKE